MAVATNVSALPENGQPKPGTSIERRFGAVTTRGVAERASTAAAETAKALVQAKFIIAIQNPRDFNLVRVRVLDACKRTRFAQVARYMKPQRGGKGCSEDPNCPKRQRADQRGNVYCNHVCGPSIRFADEAAKVMQNLDIRQDVTYEDDDTRIVQVSAMDLETNVCKSQTVSVRKTIERKQPREGQEVVGERENSLGEIVYLVKASDDELGVKEANLCAKARRNQELQLLPQDIIEDATDQVIKTIRDEVERDPKAAVKAICDAFASLNVTPDMLKEYLQHGVEESSPAEIGMLRKVYATIRDGQSTWAQHMARDEQPVEGGEGAEPKEGKLSAGRRKAGGKPKPESPTPMPQKPSDPQAGAQSPTQVNSGSAAPGSTDAPAPAFDRAAALAQIAAWLKTWQLEENDDHWLAAQRAMKILGCTPASADKLLDDGVERLLMACRQIAAGNGK